MSEALKSEVLNSDSFRPGDVPPGSAIDVGSAAVFNVGGYFCATEGLCTHRQGQLSRGVLEGQVVTCPLHGAQFEVTTGAVMRGPAKKGLKRFPVTITGEVGHVEGLL